MDLKNRAVVWFGAVMLGASLLVSCGASGNDAVDTATDAVSDSSDTAFVTGSDDAADAVEGAMVEVDGLNPVDAPLAPSIGGGAASVQGEPINVGREIIYTADLTVAVDDVVSAGQRASEVIANLGGLLFGQESVSGGSATSTYSFRIRPANFQAALSGLSTIGEVRNQIVSTEDVTGDVVDLESRISTAEASVERLRELLVEAATIEVVAELETQLLDRETTLEVMRGQLRSLRDRVDLATINLTLTEALARPSVAFTTTSYGGHDGGAACPAQNFTADAGEDVTLCFEIVNTGDAPLAQIEVRDTVLDISVDDLIKVDGELDGQLLPGQSLYLAHETTVDRTLRLRTRVTATPTSADGEPIAARSVQANRDFTVAVTEVEGLPGFTDAVQGGWNVLKTIVGVLIVVVGALIPFVWIIIPIWLFMRWQRKNSAEKAAREHQLRKGEQQDEEPDKVRNQVPNPDEEPGS